MTLTTEDQSAPVGGAGLNGAQVVKILLVLAVLLTVLRPWLPDGLVRPPEWMLLPWRDWIDAIFQYVTFDLGFIVLLLRVAEVSLLVTQLVCLCFTDVPLLLFVRTGAL